MGLAITQAMVMGGLLSWGVRQSAAMANAFVSVERVLEYASLPVGFSGWRKIINTHKMVSIAIL